MATRLYLCAAATVPVTPAFSAWTTSASALRRLMRTTTNGTDALANGSAVTSTAGQSALHRQFVSDPLAAGITFTSGSATFTCQIQGLESAANDNIINRVRTVKVFSQDGLTLRATLLALGNAASVVEWNTAMRGLTYLNVTAATASYTTVVGDRLVLEVGHNDTAGVSISGTLRFGADSAGTGDLGINETDVTTTLRPWFESSVTLTFAPPAQTVVCGTVTVTMTPGAAVRVAGGIARVAGAPVVTLSAPAATPLATITRTANAPIVTFSAPAAVRVSPVTQLAGAPSVLFSAGAATLQLSGGGPSNQTLVANAPIVTFTAPAAVRVAVATQTANAPIVTMTAPVATAIGGGVVRPAGTPVLVLSAPTATLVQPAAPGVTRPDWMLLLGVG